MVFQMAAKHRTPPLHTRFYMRDRGSYIFIDYRERDVTLEVYCKDILQKFSHALATALVREDLKTTLHVYKRMYEAVYTCKLIDLSWLVLSLLL